MGEHTPGPWTMTEPGDPGAYVENDPNSIGIVAAAECRMVSRGDVQGLQEARGARWPVLDVLPVPPSNRS